MNVKELIKEVKRLKKEVLAVDNLIINSVHTGDKRKEFEDWQTLKKLLGLR